MNKSIKDFKSNNNSGFTLIELLGVFVIMGLIILVVMYFVHLEVFSILSIMF